MRMRGDFRTGDRDSLLLAAGEFQPPLADHGRITVRKGRHEVVDAGETRRRLDLLAGGARSAIGDVVEDRVVEQHRVLWNDADGRAYARLLDLAEVLAVDQDAAVRDVIEAVEQAGDGRLAGAARPDDGERIPRRNGKGNVLEHRAPSIVSERDVVEDDAATADREAPCAGNIGDFRALVQKLEHLLHVRQRLADLAINETEKIQRQVELDEVRIHHDEVAHRHLASRDVARRHQHQRDQARRDDRALADVEEAQRHLLLFTAACS